MNSGRQTPAATAERPPPLSITAAQSTAASVGFGFTQIAQRFTTTVAGTGVHLDLNIVTVTPGTPQPYTLELWSATPDGTTVNALLATIGSGSVSTTDKTLITSFDLVSPLNAATNYFVKMNVTPDFGLVLGPNSSATLNSVLRYGVGNLNNTAAQAAAMQVNVIAVPEPGITAMGLVAVVAGGVGLRWNRRRGGRRQSLWC
ncbi:MAG: hypothetical protein ACR2IT_12665, partial [Pirellulales bacterium]